MAINRYHQPAQAEYKNTYVPIPFQEMMQIGAMTQQRQEQGENLMNDYMNRLSDYPVAPGADEAKYQDLMQGLDEEMQNALETMDPGSPDFKRTIRRTMTKQSRDPNWRMLRQNYQPYWDAVKELQDNRDMPAANRAELERYISDYKQKGSEEMGFFQSPGVIKYHNYQTELEAMGKGFRAQGEERQFFNKDGTINTTISETGVFVNDVAAAYGYEYDRGENALTLNKIPDAFLEGQGGQQMMLEARQIARQQDMEPGEVLAGLYMETTVPLINKYAGIKTINRQKLTQLGQDKLEASNFADTYLGPLNERLETAIGSGFGDEGMVKKALLLAPSGVRKLFQKAVDRMEFKEGTNLEDVLGGIDEAFAAMDKAYDIKKEEKGLLGRLMWTGSFGKGNVGLRGTLALGKKTMKETAKYAYYGNVSANPSEDDMAIALRVKEEMGIETPWEEMSKEAKSDVWKQSAEYVKDFYDTGVHTATTPVNSKTKAEASKVMFGFSSDDGRVQGANVTGGGLGKLVIDPTNPTKPLVLSDIIKKDDTIEYIGRTSYDNPYGPGLHTIGVNGQEYYMYWSEPDKAADAVPYALHDFKRNPAGVGTWFQQQDYYFRGVEGEEGEALETLTKEQFDEAVKSGKIKVNSDGNYRGSTSTVKRTNAGQGQGVMGAYYKFLEDNNLL